MVEQRRWVPNFVPGSTAREIVRWLLQSREGSEAIEKDRLEEKLTEYKQETGLDRIDLLQLREYAEFESRIVSSRSEDPRRAIRHQIAEMALDLASEKGVCL